MSQDASAPIVGGFRPQSGYTQPKLQAQQQTGLFRAAGSNNPTSSGNNSQGSTSSDTQGSSQGVSSRQFTSAPQEFEEWKERVNEIVREKIEAMIQDGTIKSNEFDQNCVNELVSQPPMLVANILDTFREILVNPPPTGPIKNTSGYLSKMLRNPIGNTGGGRGRGRSNGSSVPWVGSGRGRQGPRLADVVADTDKSLYAEKRLKEVMGEKFDQIDTKAKKLAFQQDAVVIDHLCAEYVTSHARILKLNSWLTVVINKKREKEEQLLAQESTSAAAPAAVPE